MYTWAYLRCALRDIRTAERYCRPDGSADQQKHLTDEGSFCWLHSDGRFEEDVPTERGVVSPADDEDITRGSWCGGDLTRQFSGGRCAASTAGAGADDDLEGFLLERPLHLDASADR